MSRSEVDVTMAAAAELVPGLRVRATVSGAFSFASSVAEGAMFVLLTASADAAVRSEASVELLGQQWAATTAVWAGVGLLVVKVALAVVGSSIGVSLARRSLVDTRSRLSALLVRAAPAEGDDRSGAVQDRLTTWCERVAAAAESSCSLISAYLSLAAFVLVASVLDLRAVAVLVGVGVVVALVLRPLVRRVRDSSDRLRFESNRYAGEVGEAATITDEVRVFGVGDAFLASLHRTSERAARAWGSARLLPMALSHLYQALMFAALFATIAVALERGAEGSAARIGAVVLLLVRSLSSGQQIVTYRAQLAGTLPYVRGVLDEMERLRTAELAPGRQDIDEVGDLVATSLSYAYDGERLVLDDVSVSIPKGTSLAVVGPSGAGKTTFARLLLRQALPTSGSLRADGVAVADVRADAWAALVVRVGQQPAMLTGSVADNVRFFRDLDEATVASACERAHVADEVRALPGGFDAQLGPQAGVLSGGQRQRIALARALAGDPEVIVLDEPTSALDVDAEARIAETLASLHGTITTVVIAHRWSTVAHCDQVLVLDGGRAEAIGPLDEVVASSRFVRAMRAQGDDGTTDA